VGEEVAEVAEGQPIEHGAGAVGVHFGESCGAEVFGEEGDLVEGLRDGESLEVIGDIGGVEEMETVVGVGLILTHSIIRVFERKPLCCCRIRMVGVVVKFRGA